MFEGAIQSVFAFVSLYSPLSPLLCLTCFCLSLMSSLSLSPFVIVTVHVIVFECLCVRLRQSVSQIKTFSVVSGVHSSAFLSVECLFEIHQKGLCAFDRVP